MSHIDELAELYALGSLSAAERAAIDAHAATCVECLRKLGEAEEAILALEGQYAPVEPPATLNSRLRFERSHARWWVAIAAAFVIGLLPSVWFASQRGGEANLAAIAMLHSHFNHAQFVGAANAPIAKVLYPRDKSWIYVMVEGSERYDVYAISGSVATKLGSITPQGSTSNLFVQNPGALDRVELRDGATVVESAQVR